MAARGWTVMERPPRRLLGQKAWAWGQLSIPGPRTSSVITRKTANGPRGPLAHRGHGENLTLLPGRRTLTYVARKLIVAALGSVILLSAPGAALAIPAQLTVTNLAQPGLESDVPQPPVTVGARWN